MERQADWLKSSIFKQTIRRTRASTSKSLEKSSYEIEFYLFITLLGITLLSEENYASARIRTL